MPNRTGTRKSATKEPKRAKVEEGDWGVVYVASGELAGKLVYYDDDDGGAIIYLGYPLASEMRVVPRRTLRQATDEERLEFEHRYMNDVATRRAFEQLRGSVRKETEEVEELSVEDMMKIMGRVYTHLLLEALRDPQVREAIVELVVEGCRRATQTAPGGGSRRHRAAGRS
jgi:hypothetical protein